MAKIILATDQKETPDDEILSKDWYGGYQVTLEVAGTQPVLFQRRVAPDKPWQTARFNNANIMLTAVGDTLDVTLTRDFDYRFITAAVGAEVWIDKHNPHS